jgi:Ca2+-binding RTX toxin-like protein
MIVYVGVPAAADAGMTECLGRTPTIEGTAHDEVITGTPHDDVIISKGGDDIVYGLDGDDVICSGSNKDRVFAGDGNDRVDAGMGERNEVFGGDGDDNLSADNGAMLFGEEGHDRLTSSGWSYGLDGGPGDDFMDGGEEGGVISLATADEGISVNLLSGSAAGDGSDRFVRITGVVGSKYRDYIVVGTDELFTSDLYCTVDGGSGGDSIEVRGDLGCDVNGGSGADLISGGDGDDHLYGGSDTDVIGGGAGDDGLHADGGRDALWGESGDDFLVPGMRTNLVDGGLGYDHVAFWHLSNGVLVDLAQGIFKPLGRSYMDLSDISDVEAVYGSDVADRIFGSDDIDHLDGWSGNDAVAGRDGSDIIEGSNGHDVLHGGDGIDRLDGENGHDRCINGEVTSNCEE